MATLLALACSNPAKYAQLKATIARTSRSLDAAATALFYATRNKYMVTLTDLAVYEAYYADRCQAAQLVRQCSAGVAYTAEQACDCGAGYVGATRYGPGAGEVVAGGYFRSTESACRAAIGRAKGYDHARYLAQLGRVQLKIDPVSARRTLTDAVREGFARASIDIARSVLYEVERGSVLTPLEYLKTARPYLASARDAGSRETSSTVRAFGDLADVRKLNYDFAKAWAELQR